MKATLTIDGIVEDAFDPKKVPFSIIVATIIENLRKDRDIRNPSYDRIILGVGSTIDDYRFVDIREAKVMGVVPYVYGKPAEDYGPNDINLRAALENPHSDNLLVVVNHQFNAEIHERILKELGYEVVKL